MWPLAFVITVIIWNIPYIVARTPVFQQEIIIVRIGSYQITFILMDGSQAEFP